jgi:hypothetical protein
VTNATATADQFGFLVEHCPAERWSPAGWRVVLPHQCDEWRIDDSFSSASPTSKERALARLDAFIAEAQAARAALATGQPYGDRNDWPTP